MGEDFLNIAREYQEKIEDELKEICKETIDLVEGVLLPRLWVGRNITNNNIKKSKNKEKKEKKEKKDNNNNNNNNITSRQKQSPRYSRKLQRNTRLDINQTRKFST